MNVSEVIKKIEDSGHKVSTPETYHNGSSYGKQHSIIGSELVDSKTHYLGLPIKTNSKGFISKNGKVQNFYVHNGAGFNTSINLNEFLLML